MSDRMLLSSTGSSAGSKSGSAKVAAASGLSLRPVSARSLQRRLDQIFGVDLVERGDAGSRHVRNATAEFGFVQFACNDIVCQRPACVSDNTVSVAFWRRFDLRRPTVEPLLA